MTKRAPNKNHSETPTRRLEKSARAADSHSSKVHSPERAWFYNYVGNKPYPALVTDETGMIVFVNRHTGLLFRYSPRALVGLPVQHLVPEHHRKTDARSRDSSILPPTTGKLGVWSVYTGLRADGTEFPMEFMISEVDYADGRAEVVYHFIDATERKRIETWFELAVEASPTGMLLVDGSGLIRLANRQAYRLFGYDAGHLVHTSIDELVPERYRSGHPMLRKSYQDAPSVRMIGVGRDLHGRRRDGSEFPVEIGLSPLRTPDGIMVLCSIVDISERKAAEQEQAHRAEELQRINAELDDFAYIASHDLQEPLLKVQSFGDLLAQEYQETLGEEGLDYLRRIRNATQRMKTLIADLLNYSRITRSTERLIPVNLSEVVKDVLGDLEVRVEELKAELAVAPLPVITADPLQMRQLFQNILGNALKYHHPERQPRIEIACEPALFKPTEKIDQRWMAGAAVRITIRDNGIGFENTYAEEIFKPFRRLHGQGSYQGTGIGLAVCKKIVERHSGRIRAYSQLHEGTTIEIILPGDRERGDKVDAAP